MKRSGAKSMFVQPLWRSPDQIRLTASIGETWLALDHQVQRFERHKRVERPETMVPPPEWARTAWRYLLQAEASLATRDFHQGWNALLCAQRVMLEDPTDEERMLRIAITLRREATKITGWRSKAIGDLICGEEGELRDGLDKQPQRVIDAVALRDDQAHTTAFRILLRRRHLLQLFVILSFGIAACLLLSYLNVLPTPFDDTKQVMAVVLFGALGAGLSVSQGLLSSGVSERIPAQQIGAFVVWMRPMIGAVAALVALAVLYANDPLKIFAWDTKNPALINIVSFVAGFSERFIAGAIEKISMTKDKKD